MTIKRILLGLVLAMVGAATASAQDFYKVSTKPIRGLLPNADQLSSPVDTIDPVNRTLHLEIPLASLPQGPGGTRFELKAIYDSHLWEMDPHPLPPPFPWNQGENPSPPAAGYLLSTFGERRGGWGLNIDNLGLDFEERIQNGPGAPCETWPRIYKLSVRLLDGSRHVMHLKGWGPEITGSPYSGDGFFPLNPAGRIYCPLGYMQLATGWLTYFSNDGSHLKLEIYADGSGNWGSPWYLYLPDGSRIVQDSEGKHIYDANGNGIHIGDHCADAGCNDVYYGVVDDAGHFIRLGGDYYTTTVTTTGPNGPLTTTLNWESFSLTSRNYTVKSPTDMSPWDATVPFNADIVALKYIQMPLPENGLTPGAWNRYEFGYADNANNGWGELDYMRTPTGALFEYRYSREGTQIWPSFAIARDNKLVTRTVSYDGGTPLTWTYAGGPNPFYTGGFQSASNTVTNPDSTVATYWWGPDPTPYAHNVGSYPLGHLVYRIDEPNGRVTKRLWSRNPPPVGQIPDGSLNPAGNQNAFVKRETITVGNAAGAPALATVTERYVDKNGNLRLATEYDWVPYNPNGPELGSSVKRETVYTYHAAVKFYDGSGTGDDAKTYWQPHFSPLTTLQSRRLDALWRKEVYDAGANVRAVSELEYDFPYSRGNLTVEKKWDSDKASSAPGLGQLSASNSQVVTRAYDNYGNVTDIYEPRNNPNQEIRTHITYDPTGSFATQVDNAVGANEHRSWGYNWNTAAGTLTSKTDLDNNLATIYTYDNVGREKTVTEAGLRKTETLYDDAGMKVTQKSDLVSLNDALLKTVSEYDALGRLMVSRSRETTGTVVWLETKTLHYPASNITIKSSPYRETPDSQTSWVCTQTDALKRVIAIATFNGSAPPANCGTAPNRTGVATSEYDAQWVTITDQALNVRKERRDALGRLLEVVEDPSGLNYSTTYTYDTLDHLTQVNQGSQTPRTFQYSSLGRLKSAFNPESGTVNYEYYDSGELKKRTDARGVVAEFDYDPLRRIKNKTYSFDPAGTPAMHYTYYLAGEGAPKVGQLKQAYSSLASSTNDTYDNLGRVTGSHHTIDGNNTTFNFSYSYFLNGAVQSVANPSGRVVTYSVDDAGRTKTVASGGTVYADLTAAGSYMPDGRIAKIALGNGLFESRTYDVLVPGSSLTTTFKVGTSATTSERLKLDYGFSPTQNNGNVLSQVIQQGSPVFTQTYGYDGVSRLTSASEANGWSRTYGYDRYGNRWVSSSSANLQTDSHEPTSSDNFTLWGNNRVNIASATYDNAGNQTTYTPYTLAYDAENRMVGATSAQNGSGNYVYDGDGKRVKKTWTSSSGTVTTYYLHNALGKLAAEYSTQAATPGTTYPHTDVLGSTRLVTNSTGAAVECYDYEPFGRMLTSNINSRGTGCYPADLDAQSASKLTQKFTGKERDAETKLDFFGARYYSAAQGRFTSADPIVITDERLLDPQRLNLYGYARNNPLRFIDPDGKDVVEYVLHLMGDNRLPKGPQNPGMSEKDMLKLGLLSNNSGTSFLLNTEAKFEPGDNPADYKPLRNAFIRQSPTFIDDDERHRSRGDENPTKNQILNQGSSQFVLDIPGFRIGSSPKASINGTLDMVFVLGVQNTKAKGKPVSKKKMYYRLIMKFKGGVLEENGLGLGEIPKELFEQLGGKDIEEDQ